MSDLISKILGSQPSSQIVDGRVSKVNVDGTFTVFTSGVYINARKTISDEIKKGNRVILNMIGNDIFIIGKLNTNSNSTDCEVIING